MIPFDIPTILRSGWYISGGQGSGKSKLAIRFADMMMKAGITVYAFDSTQVWQKKSSIPYYHTFWEDDCTFSFNSIRSTIFDLSLLYGKDQRHIMQKIVQTIFMHRARHPNQKRFPIVFIFEEAHLYMGQGVMRSKAFEEVMRLITAGRNFALRPAFITQFASMIDKLCVKSTQQRYFGYTDEPNDIKYLSYFLGDRASELNELKVGEFLYDFGKTTERIQTPEFFSDRKPQPLMSKRWGKL